MFLIIGHFLHSECTASRRGNTDIDFTTTLPVAEVGAITSSQTSLSATTFVSNIEVAKTQAVSSGAVSQVGPDPNPQPNPSTDPETHFQSDGCNFDPPPIENPP